MPESSFGFAKKELALVISFVGWDGGIFESALRKPANVTTHCRGGQL